MLADEGNDKRSSVSSASTSIGPSLSGVSSNSRTSQHQQHGYNRIQATPNNVEALLESFKQLGDMNEKIKQHQRAQAMVELQQRATCLLDIEAQLSSFDWHISQVRLGRMQVTERSEITSCLSNEACQSYVDSLVHDLNREISKLNGEHYLIDESTFSPEFVRTTSDPSSYKQLVGQCRSEFEDADMLCQTSFNEQTQAGAVPAKLASGRELMNERLQLHFKAQHDYRENIIHAHSKTLDACNVSNKSDCAMPKLAVDKIESPWYGHTRSPRIEKGSEP